MSLFNVADPEAGFVAYLGQDVISREERLGSPNHMTSDMLGKEKSPWG